MVPRGLLVVRNACCRLHGHDAAARYPRRVCIAEAFWSTEYIHPPGLKRRRFKNRGDKLSSRFRNVTSDCFSVEQLASTAPDAEKRLGHSLYTELVGYAGRNLDQAAYALERAI
jgi:hypothetical protein